MTEFLLISALLFAAYLFLPYQWIAKFMPYGDAKTAIYGKSINTGRYVPEDATLRRHFMTQLRSEIELELASRPTDVNLQRHYDALVNAKLESRLNSFRA
jgi:hypothetical protein